MAPKNLILLLVNAYTTQLEARLATMAEQLSAAQPNPRKDTLLHATWAACEQAAALCEVGAREYPRSTLNSPPCGRRSERSLKAALAASNQQAAVPTDCKP